jgi:hypothetical protein
MFISISNSDDSTFPKNLIFGMSIYTNNNSNNLSFTININVIEKKLNLTESYNISFVGSYCFDTKKLLVSEKCRNNFKDEFYFNNRILVPELFTKYILPRLVE